jgi:hypothetical protein
VQRVRGEKGGGLAGEAWALHLDAASPALRAVLKLSETVVEGPFEPALKARPRERDFDVAGDKMRIIAPILAHPKGSEDRAAAFAATAAVPHVIGGKITRVAVRTLRDWVRTNECGKGIAALIPRSRQDIGRPRVAASRKWDAGCGLSAEARADVA